MQQKNVNVILGEKKKITFMQIFFPVAQPKYIPRFRWEHHTGLH